jgi:hypothetical protein
MPLFSGGLYSGVDREAIWAALFALLQSKLSASYITMGRHHVMPPALSPEQQPALFAVPVRETRGPRPPGVPVKLTLDGYLILYFQAPSPLLEKIGSETVLGATTLNGLLKGIDDALEPDNPTTGKLTLGGLVDHCWIEGDADMDTGIFTQQGAAIVPIRILVP